MSAQALCQDVNLPQPASQLCCTCFNLTSTLGFSSLTISGVEVGGGTRRIVPHMIPLIATLPVRARSLLWLPRVRLSRAHAIKLCTSALF